MSEAGAPRPAQAAGRPPTPDRDALAAQPSPPGRYRRTVGGLVASILAALGLIAAVWGLTWFQHRDVPNPSPTVSYLPQLAQARAASPFAVLAPDPPPPGWRATSASWDGSPPEYAWHLGFLIGDGDDAEYVGLEQSNGEPADVVAGGTRADQPGPPVVISGQRWQTMTSSDGAETALIHTARRVTTVVTGTATEDQLVAFVKTLAAH